MVQRLFHANNLSSCVLLTIDVHDGSNTHWRVVQLVLRAAMTAQERHAKLAITTQIYDNLTHEEVQDTMAGVVEFIGRAQQSAVVT